MVGERHGKAKLAVSLALALILAQTAAALTWEHGGVTMMQLDNSGNLNITGNITGNSIKNCPGKIYTDANGLLLCGTDATGNPIPYWIDDKGKIASNISINGGGVNITGGLTIDNNSLIINGLSCSGTATACTGLSVGQCGASADVPQYGCRWFTGDCLGSSTSCSVLSLLECTQQLGCSIGYTTNNMNITGDGSISSRGKSFLLGSGLATGRNSLAVGRNANATGINSIAMGYNALANGSYSLSPEAQATLPPTVILSSAEEEVTPPPASIQE